MGYNLLISEFTNVETHQHVKHFQLYLSINNRKANIINTLYILCITDSFPPAKAIVKVNRVVGRGKLEKKTYSYLIFCASLFGCLGCVCIAWALISSLILKLKAKYVFLKACTFRNY